MLLELRNEVIRLGTEYPNAKYIRELDGYYQKPCRYASGKVENGPPEKCGCIFGQALTNIGKADIFEFWDHGLGMRIDEGFIELGFHSEEDSVLLDQFRLVQESQDNGNTWGEAIKVLTPTVS